MKLGEISDQLTSLKDALVRSHPPDVMTTQEASAYLNMSEMTVFNMRKDGKGPKFFQPTPRLVRYLKEDLIDWVKTGSQ